MLEDKMIYKSHLKARIVNINQKSPGELIGLSRYGRHIH